ncbi:MAG: glycosyltransferase family 4 protein [Wenzhouxiangella sp.]|nr:glycosyltransferase family 4 protein [Wenzhouxiangella sp.]
MTILILGSLSRSLLNFRGPLIERLVAAGHTVITAAAHDEDSDEVTQALAQWGVAHHSIPLARGGLNPLADLRTFRAFRRLIRQTRPDGVLAYTAKPVIYGGLATRALSNVRFFPMITGVGYAFTSGVGLKRRAVRRVLTHLYRRALRHAERVIFQNPDDQALFTSLGLVAEPKQAARVNGSGVDRDAFPPQPLPPEPVFLMIARLVADKGVREYVDAARRVRAVHPEARFRLVGDVDPNPSGISQRELDAWIREGCIEYVGPLANVQPELARCRYYVLPSYREGTPRSVLEAMATGRPVITTDVPGCRETVEHGVNGLLVARQDAQALAGAMEALLALPTADAQAMADEGLAMVKARFDVDKVNDQMMEILELSSG